MGYHVTCLTMTPLMVETTSSELPPSIDGCCSMTAIVAVLIPIPGNADKSSDSMLSLLDLLQFMIICITFALGFIIS